MDRRTAFISSALALAAVGTATTASAGNKGGFKRTVLYGTPKNPQEFDKYYFETHTPLVIAAKGAARIEIAKCSPLPDGSAPPFYLIFEIWFDSQGQMDEVLGSSAWKAVREDVKNFASGGVTAFLSKIEM